MLTDRLSSAERFTVSEELEIELEPEEEDNIHVAFFDKLTTEEQRRYVCLDMARLCGSLPDKVVEHAAKMEKFMLGKSLRAVND